MGRTDFCNRVGCGQEAEAVLLMIPQSMRAWIVDPEHEKAPDGSPLCGTHAGRTTVPNGWVLTDSRTTKRKRRKERKSTAKKQSVETEIISDAYPEPDMTIEIPIEDVQVVFEVETPDRSDGGNKDEEEAIEELTSEPFEESLLHIVPDGMSPEEITQGSLWDENQILPTEETPLLQRAFRLVSDE